MLLSRYCFFTRFSIVLALAVLAACAGTNTKKQLPDPARENFTRGKTLVYECSGNEFVARMGEDDIAIWLEDRQLILPQVPSGSGVKYEKEGLVFWSKGEEAMLIIGNQQFPDCKLAPRRVPWEDARRRGVDFRAVGNEPGWTIEIRHDSHILYVGDYGQTRVLFSKPQLETQGEHTTYLASNGTKELRVEITDELCTDTMKGDTFSAKVTISYAGNIFRGCGNSLVSDWE